MLLLTIGLKENLRYMTMKIKPQAKIKILKNKQRKQRCYKSVVVIIWYLLTSYEVRKRWFL